MIILSLSFSRLVLPIDIQAVNLKSAVFACSFTTNLAAIDESRDYQRMVRMLAMSRVSLFRQRNSLDSLVLHHYITF
ncbi:unnamed protein product [Cylicostephanus goldi]|uniref:Uncharacterized protein n=1 Tax=Cylicostephanus goldi TaxID=71465 RepID=A0A3P6U244_CYLGO|nr:unnamed protein product [Cylicostephanus goldi]